MSLTKNTIMIVSSIFAIILAASLLMKYNEPTKPVQLSDPASKGTRDFYVYNYYKVPIQVLVNGEVIGDPINPKQRLGIDKTTAIKYFSNGKAKVRVYAKSDTGKYDMLIGKSETHTPKNTMIRGLHLGMNSAHEDYSLVADPIRSTLGTALPRLRIVNDTTMKLKFQIGSDQICLSPGEDKMYFGEEDHGIHLGSIIHNIDGILQDFTVTIPVTDVHLGIISDRSAPLYTGVKIGGDFDDTVQAKNYLLELWDMGGPHRGMFSDKTYII